MPRVIHFEIAAENPEALCDFYRNVFGWDIPDSNEGYWLVNTGTGPGINGGIMGPHFPQKTNAIIEVDSLDDTVRKIEQSGGKKVHGPNQIPNVGLHAYCTDPSGTMFGVLQPAPEWLARSGG